MPMWFEKPELLGAPALSSSLIPRVWLMRKCGKNCVPQKHAKAKYMTAMGKGEDYCL